MLIARAPFRLSLFGGGSDYPEYFQTRKCQVVSAAIQRFCYVALRDLPPFFKTHKSRIVWSRIELVDDPEEIQHPSVRAVLQSYGVLEGVEIHHFSDLPSRSGIGSSSAFTVALIAAVSKFLGQELQGMQLATRAIHIERNINEEPVGIQDQITSAIGGLIEIRASQSQEVSASQLSLSHEYISHLESSILMGFFGNERLSSDFSEKAIDGIMSTRDIQAIDSMVDIAEQASVGLKKECSIEYLGSLLNETWRLKQSLNSATADLRVIDDLFQAAIMEGATGGKLMGAGGSGFFYVLAPPSRHERIRRRLSSIRIWNPIKFDLVGAVVGDSSRLFGESNEQ